MLVWSIRAADEAMRVLAPDEALQHLERALAAWPNVEDAAALAGESEGRVAVRAARAAGLAGEPARAIEWARRAIRLCDDDGDGTGGVQARAELVRQLLVADATDQTVRPAEEAVRARRGRPRSTPTRWHSPTWCWHGHCWRPGASTRRARRPSARWSEARAAGAPGLEVEALATKAFLDEIDGDRQGAADGLGDGAAAGAGRG